MKIIIDTVKQFLNKILPLKYLPLRKWDETERLLRITARHNRLTVTATNFDATVIIHCCGVRVIIPGTIDVYGKKFFEVMGDLINRKNFELSASAGVLQCGISKLAAVESERVFPDIYDNSLVPYCIIDVTDMKDIFYAAGKTNTRYTLNAICADLRSSSLVATDGKKLAVRKIMGQADINKVLIPWQTVDMICRLGKQFLLCGTGKENIMVLKNHDTFIQFFTVEGTYPNYNQIIYRQHESSIIVERRRLQKGVRQILAIEPPEVNFYIRDDKLILASSNKDGDTARVEMPCAYSCDPLAGFCVDPESAYDTLQKITKKSIRIEFSGDIPICLKDVTGKELYGIIATRRKTFDCGYTPDPDEPVYVETVCWIEERLLKHMHDLYIKRRDMKDLRRKGRLIISSPLEDYIPYDPQHDDIKMEYKGNIIHNTVIDIMGILYPGWKWQLKQYRWMQVDKLRPLPPEDVRLREITAFYHGNSSRKFDFWGIDGELGGILTEKQFVQAISDRADRFIDMVETARAEKRRIKITFLKNKED